MINQIHNGDNNIIDKVKRFIEINYSKYKPRIIGVTYFYDDISLFDSIFSKAFEKFVEEIKDAITPYLLQDFGEELNYHIKLKNSLLIPPHYDDFEARKLMLKCDYTVTKVIGTPVIYKLVEDTSSIPKDYHRCNYCSGHTKNDMRGHCSGCGGPRGGMS